MCYHFGSTSFIFEVVIVKCVKIITLAILAIVLPFIIIRVSVEFVLLSDLVDKILFAFPLYLPFVFVWSGIKIFEATNKIFHPILFLDLLLAFVVFLLVKMLFDGTERSLADSVALLLLIGPLIYSIPASFIGALIYRRKNELQNIENDTQK